MGEKRGMTGKLVYDFDTANVCEIGTTTDDGIKWYRTTSKRFRSWDGPRRLTRPVEQPSHGYESFQNVEMETVEYDGPLYIYDTNVLVTVKQGTETYIESPKTIEDETLYVRRGNRI